MSPRVGQVVALCVVSLWPAMAAAKKAPDLSTSSDEALIHRLTELGRQINARVDTGQLLIALRPEPAYVMTSSTTFFGHLTGSASIYTMPYGYQGRFTGTLTGTAITTYSYYDVNSFSRALNGLALLINQISLQRKQREFQAVLSEIENRIQNRRRQLDLEIRRFFASNPSLRGKEAVLAAVLPWVVSQNPGFSATEALNAAKEVVLELARRSDLTGKWYGVFAQHSVLETGEQLSLNSFVVVELVQSEDGKVRGQGYLGTGDAIFLAGEVAGETLVGRVENVTSGYHTVFSARVGADRFDAEFKGTAQGEVYSGRAVLVR